MKGIHRLREKNLRGKSSFSLIDEIDVYYSFSGLVRNTEKAYIHKCEGAQ